MTVSGKDNDDNSNDRFKGFRGLNVSMQAAYEAQ